MSIPEHHKAKITENSERLWRALGIDVENLADELEFNQIASRFFSRDEASFIGALSSYLRAEAFFKYWMTKEATLKVIGVGLLGSMDKVVIPLSELIYRQNFRLYGYKGGKLPLGRLVISSS